MNLIEGEGNLTLQISPASDGAGLEYFDHKVLK
jgi:hypothetical protein